MKMELSDDSNESTEMKDMKNQLAEFGLDEDNLSKEEMKDLLKAFNNSKEPCGQAKEDHPLQQKVDEPVMNTSKITMKRRYLDVDDRRMPWSLLPRTISQAEKARTLAVYIKLMAINTYRQARKASLFAPWPPGIQIVEETGRMKSARSTRSGRSAPVYAEPEDDPDDLDFVIAKPKKRKTSTSEQTNESTSLVRFPSLKRKSSKDDNCRPMKESKLVEVNELEIVSKPNSRVDTILSLIED